MLNQLRERRYLCRTFLRDVWGREETRIQFGMFWIIFRNDSNTNDTSTLNRKNSTADIKRICFASWGMVANVYKVAISGIGKVGRAVQRSIPKINKEAYGQHIKFPNLLGDGKHSFRRRMIFNFFYFDPIHFRKVEYSKLLCELNNFEAIMTNQSVSLRIQVLQKII